MSTRRTGYDIEYVSRMHKAFTEESAVNRAAHWLWILNGVLMASSGSWRKLYAEASDAERANFLLAVGAALYQDARDQGKAVAEEARRKGEMEGLR